MVEETRWFESRLAFINESGSLEVDKEERKPA